MGRVKRKFKNGDHVVYINKYNLSRKTLILKGTIREYGDGCYTMNYIDEDGKEVGIQYLREEVLRFDRDYNIDKLLDDKGKV